MPKMVCIVTGPIVGLRSGWFLDDTVKFAANLKKIIVVYNVFEEIIEQENIQPRNAFERATYIGELLDGYQYQFNLMRQKAYLSIARKIDKLPKTANVIIRTPASIEWRGVNLELKDHKLIAELLNPDRIVTLIDAEWKINKRLCTEYGKHALNKIAHQKQMNIERILDWLGSEVSRSEDLAEWSSHITGKNVRHFVLGMETPSYKNRRFYIRDVDNMVKFATEKKLTTFYASYSMTVATEKIRKEINDLIWRLRSYGAVIDPASIEIEQNVTHEEKPVVFAYTVCRDLRWDVQKVDAVTAFHPYIEIPPLSTGMLDEIGHARAFRKERYLVMPVGADSPFTKDNYVSAEHVFKEGSALFKYFEQKRRPPLKPRFADNIKEFAKWQEQKFPKRTKTK